MIIVDLQTIADQLKKQTTTIRRGEITLAEVSTAELKNIKIEFKKGCFEKPGSISKHLFYFKTGLKAMWIGNLITTELKVFRSSPYNLGFSANPHYHYNFEISFLIIIANFII